MEIPIAGSVEKIIFEALKKGYSFLDEKAEIWIKTRFAIKKYLENLIENLNVVHVHRSEQIKLLEKIFVKTRIITTILSERYLPDSAVLEEALKENIPRGEIAIQNKRNIRNEIRRIHIRETDYCEPNEVIGRFRKAIILGGPGAGKTSYFKNTIIELARDKDFEQIPIFIPLRDSNYLASGLLEYIGHRFNQFGIENAEALVLQLLKDGRLILFLDGLDEVPERQRSERIEEISAFSVKYGGNRYYVSSRMDAYAGELEGFKELELEGFGETHVRQFVTNWLSDSPSSKDELLNHINSYPQIEEITDSPLILSLICIVFENDLHIPSRRTTLYKRCLECLLRDWDAQRNFRRETVYSKLDDEKKIGLLSHIAFKLHSDNKIYFRNEHLVEYLAEIIEKYGIEKSEVRKLIREIQSHTGILTSISKEYSSFCHLTFQEYLAARYICENQLLFEILNKYGTDSFWSEVLILSSSILADSSSYLEHILDRSNESREYIALAGNCLLVDPVANRELKERIVNKVIQCYFNADKKLADQCLQILVKLDTTFIGRQISSSLGIGDIFLSKLKDLV